MNTPNNSQAATSEHRHGAFWQRLSPFLDVIGAVLIFGSWILSHALSQQAQDHAKTHQGIIDRVRTFRLYDDFGQRISGIQSDLVRTRNLVEQAIPSGGSLDSRAASEGLTWTGMTVTQVRELNDFVEALGRYAGQLSTSESTTQLMELAVSEARETAEAFDSARDEFDRLVDRQNTSASTAANEAVTEAEQEELRRRVDLLWQDYDTAKQGLMRLGDELLRTAAAESKSASQLAKQCEHLSWALYILGTLIILFGRARSVMSAQKATASE